MSPTQYVEDNYMYKCYLNGKSRAYIGRSRLTKTLQIFDVAQRENWEKFKIVVNADFPYMIELSLEEARKLLDELIKERYFMEIAAVEAELRAIEDGNDPLSLTANECLEYLGDDFQELTDNEVKVNHIPDVKLVTLRIKAPTKSYTEVSTHYLKQEVPLGRMAASMPSKKLPFNNIFAY